MTNSITLNTGEVLDLALFPLPEGYEDGTFNREQLAKAMNTSVVTISKWVDQGMPVAHRGGNGQSYEFTFSHCYAWRLWREECEAAERRNKESHANQLALLFFGSEEEQPEWQLTPKEVKERSEAELIRNKAAEQRGELVRAAQMQNLLDHMLVSYRNAVMNLPDYLEQEFSLSPHQVAKAEAFCDGILSETRRQIADAGFEPGEVVALDRQPGG